MSDIEGKRFARYCIENEPVLLREILPKAMSDIQLQQKDNKTARAPMIQMDLLIYRDQILCNIPGDTIEEIKCHLEFFDFILIRKLMVVFCCKVEDLAHNIAKSKRIKSERIKFD